MTYWLLVSSAVLLFLLLLSPVLAFGVALCLTSTSVEASLMPITALTQDVLPGRSGRVNTLFRAVDISAHIAVPLLVTSLTSQSDKTPGTATSVTCTGLELMLADLFFCSMCVGGDAILFSLFGSLSGATGRSTACGVASEQGQLRAVNLNNILLLTPLDTVTIAGWFGQGHVCRRCA